MTRHWFSGELETVASYWRVYRRDGVTLGFTSHDRDLLIDDIRHRSAPGMVPSAIRMTAQLDPDSAEVQGALDHRAITGSDLVAGRYDDARVEIGIVDWENLQHEILFTGMIGRVARDGEAFEAELTSSKARLAIDPIPRTSPTCRALFCGPGCNLSSARHSHETKIIAVDSSQNSISISGQMTAADFLDGTLRWLDGDAAGVVHRVIAVDGGRLLLDPDIPEDIGPGARALLREGCDHRLETCAERFGNAINFRGEPFLPGNDLLTRYPVPGS
ncbi:DUF2163 domain-containing protein [uncultured Croceicoccus sp.]|uniref:DUF2163 domain-containing protein n=1 Tax=uncultured Croceicoccus sp. TaxID=1295329 RepID=UPI00262CFA0A|nr:DUF2163 domain-containing protein [uncultured Croceicoccus sp.]